MRRFAVLTMTLFLGGAFVAPAQKEGEPEISVRIQPTKKVYRKGEAITFLVELTNRSQRDLYVGRDLSLMCTSPAITFNAWNSKGELEPTEGCASDCFGKSNPDSLSVAVMKSWIALPPKSRFGQVIAIATIPSLDKPGRYRISAVYQSNGLEEENWGYCIKATPEEFAQLPYAAWKGKSESKPVWIEIVRPRNRNTLR